MVVRWPGHIKPGTVHNQLFAALDRVPTLVDIAGGPKADGLKQQIEAGQYPGISSRPLSMAINQREYLEGKSQKVGARLLLLFLGLRRRRCATRTGRCTTPCRSQDLRAG
jgi:arylsulfatase